MRDNTKDQTKRTKLLFVCHSKGLDGGGERSLIELIEYVKQQKYKVYAVVPGSGSMQQALEALGIHVITTRYYWWGREFSAQEAEVNIEAIDNIAATIKSQNIDVVITNTLMVPWGALAAAVTNTPHVWTAREFLINHHAHLDQNYDFVGSYSNVIIANSQNNTNYIKQKLPGANVDTFFSYIDISKYRLNPKITTTRLVCVGNIHPDKNQLEIIKALKRLNVSLPDLRLVLVGGYEKNDPYYNECLVYAQKHGLSGRVDFVGRTDAPFEYVGPNDIFVQPSKMESLGRSITEAMKLGLMCVGADIPGTSEAFDLGGGTLYRLGDDKDLAKQIHALIDDLPGAQKRADVAQKRALTNLSRDASNKPFVKTVKSVIGKPNPRQELRAVETLFSGTSQALRDITARSDAYKSSTLHYKEKYNAIIHSEKWTVLNSGLWKYIKHANRIKRKVRKRL